MHQLRYQHSVRARVLRPLRCKGSEGCTRDCWSRTTQEQLGPTGCEIHTSTIYRATANWDWQNFLVIEIIERPTYRHINFHPKEFLTGVSESTDSFPGYRSDVKINATTESKIISNMPDNQKINKIRLKDEFSPRIIIRTSKRMLERSTKEPYEKGKKLDRWQINNPGANVQWLADRSSMSRNYIFSLNIFL